MDEACCLPRASGMLVGCCCLRLTGHLGVGVSVTPPALKLLCMPHSCVQRIVITVVLMVA